MIKILGIRIKNFGSIIDPINYEFDSPGINLILGKNGRGKTTIFSALTWCIWGTPLKPGCNVEPWEHLRPKDYEGPEVMVAMEIDKVHILIDRGKKLVLFYDHLNQEHLRNKKDVQAEIDRLMGISFNLAKNSLVFGQKLTRLLSEKGDAQKKLFDEAFQAAFINQAKEKAWADRDRVHLEYEELKNKYNELYKGFKTTKEMIAQMKKMFGSQQQGIIQTYHDAYLKKVKEIKDALKDKPEYERLQAEEQRLALQIEKNQKKLDELFKLEKKHFRLDMTHSQEQAHVTGLESQMRQIKMDLASRIHQCPTCGQPIKPIKFGEIRQKMKDQWNALNKERLESIRKVNDAMFEMKEVAASILKYKKLKEDTSELNKSLAELLEVGYDQCLYKPGLIKKFKAEAVELHKKYQLEKSKKPDLDWYRHRLKKYKEDALLIKPQYQEKRQEFNLLFWLVTDPLSNKGLKAYIFNSMLSTVNARLKTYARFTGFTVHLAIDLDSGRKNFEAIIHKGKNKIEYSDLSGGEQQLADVSLAFAIHDVIAMDNRFNILIMDEVFESLDEDNIDTVLEMLKEKSNNISIHLITHQKKLSVLKVSKVTHLKKINGKTILA